MKRFFRQSLAATALMAIGSFLVPSCADNKTTLFVFGVQAPPDGSQPGSCVFKNDPSVPQLFEGTLDVAFRDTYEAVLLLGSHFATRTDLSRSRTESSILQIEGTSVRVTDSAGNEITSFSKLANATIQAAIGGAASYGVMTTTLIDQKTALDLVKTSKNRSSKRVVAYIKAFGHTLGGTAVESAEYGFPVNVCYGCLVTFPSDAVDVVKQDLDRLGRPNCLVAAGAAALRGCFYGQDSFIDCRACSRTNEVCNPLFPSIPASYPEVSTPTPTPAPTPPGPTDAGGRG